MEGPEGTSITQVQIFARILSLLKGAKLSSHNTYITSPALLLDLLVFMESWGSFQGEEDRFWLPPWAFCPAKHGWKSFFALNGFPPPMRDFKNLKGIWHKCLSCSCQLRSNFWLLISNLHVLILIWYVYRFLVSIGTDLSHLPCKYFDLISDLGPKIW